MYNPVQGELKRSLKLLCIIKLLIKYRIDPCPLHSFNPTSLPELNSFKFLSPMCIQLQRQKNFAIFKSSLSARPKSLQTQTP